MPGQGPAPVTPPFFAYSAQRGMRRVLLDVRDPEGRDAFLALAAGADVVVESFRPGVVDRLGIGYEAVRAVQRRRRLLLDERLRPGRPPRRRGPGHDLDYLAVGGYLATSRPARRRRAPHPGRHHRRRRRRRHARRAGHLRRAGGPSHHR